MNFTITDWKGDKYHSRCAYNIKRLNDTLKGEGFGNPSLGKLPVIPSTDRELPNLPVSVYALHLQQEIIYPGWDNPKGVILVYVDFWDEAHFDVTEMTYGLKRRVTGDKFN